MRPDCDDCENCMDTDCDEYWKLKMQAAEERIKENIRGIRFGR